jgi:hypothetical protein
MPPFPKPRLLLRLPRVVADQRPAWVPGFQAGPSDLFEAGSFSFQLASVHLYFGSDLKISMNRRALETFAVARWADQRRERCGKHDRGRTCLADVRYHLSDHRPLWAEFAI